MGVDQGQQDRDVPGGFDGRLRHGLHRLPGEIRAARRRGLPRRRGDPPRPRLGPIRGGEPGRQQEQLGGQGAVAAGTGRTGGAFGVLGRGPVRAAPYESVVAGPVRGVQDRRGQRPVQFRALAGPTGPGGGRRQQRALEDHLPGGAVPQHPGTPRPGEVLLGVRATCPRQQGRRRTVRQRRERQGAPDRTGERLQPLPGGVPQHGRGGEPAPFGGGQRRQGRTRQRGQQEVAAAQPVHRGRPPRGQAVFGEERRGARHVQRRRRDVRRVRPDQTAGDARPAAPAFGDHDRQSPGGQRAQRVPQDVGTEVVEPLDTVDDQQDPGFDPAQQGGHRRAGDRRSRSPVLSIRRVREPLQDTPPSTRQAPRAGGHITRQELGETAPGARAVPLGAGDAHQRPSVRHPGGGDPAGERGLPGPPRSGDDDTPVPGERLTRRLEGGVRRTRADAAPAARHLGLPRHETAP